jgi:putative protein kinase ArgK-like GTPase of G3E family
MLTDLISKIENRDRDLPRMMELIYPRTGRAQVWGVGKSTLIDGLISCLRAKGKKVALVTVSGIPTQKHATDEGVFIHVLGTREKQGDLLHVIKEVLLAIDSAGFDVILVETADADILRLTQTVIASTDLADVSVRDPYDERELIAAIEHHQAKLIESGARQIQAREFLQNEVFDILTERLSHSVREAFKTTSGKDVLNELIDRRLDPYKAADLISNQ